ncbi:restriction endonuclease subunit S [Providencia sp. M-8]|uniref:restriction endonuclease subunit S n=1 Tax=Providencia sp. M-8 TaxID=2713151 RepID=UPI00140D8E40|nr:restriction endonuclease subunit S [Providencia sp. M-8]
MSEWVELKLTEVGSLQRGKSKHRPRYAFHLYNGKYPFIQTGEVRESRKYISEFKNTYSEAGLAQSKLWPKNTLCITIAANIAELGILKFDACFPDSVIGFIPDKNKSNLDFVYYTLCHFQRELKHLGEGSVQDNINLGTFNDIKFMFPSLAEQKAIASVLSSLDDKIDLLHRQNKTLESMAETLFRQWFVEEAQDDWERKPLTKIATFTNGLACQKYPPKKGELGLPVLKIKELNSGITDSSDVATKDVKPDYIVEHGDIIFAWSASLMVKIWSGERCVLNQHLFNVKSNKFPKWFIYEWCKYYLDEFISISQSHATTMGHIKRKDLDEAIALIPPKDELDAMDIEMSALFESKVHKLRQIQTLEKLRDTLLPKLMSGEVRVSYTPEEIKQ